MILTFKATSDEKTIFNTQFSKQSIKHLNYDRTNISTPYDLQIPHVHDERETAFRLDRLSPS